MPPETPRTTWGAVGGTTCGRDPVLGDPAVASVVMGSGGGAEVVVDGGRLTGLLLGGQLGGVDVLAGQQVVVDLAQGDRQRLLLDVGVHERADVLEQALAQLGVVGVDLPGALGA